MASRSRDLCWHLRNLHSHSNTFPSTNSTHRTHTWLVLSNRVARLFDHPV